MSVTNPYMLAVPKDGRGALCRARRMFEPIISQHMTGFGAALEGFANDPKKAAERVRAHTLMRLSAAAAAQAKHAITELLHSDPRFQLMAPAAMEAALAASTLNANITSFITQMIHLTMDVYPRLIAPNLMSVQPLTQPSGFAFHMKRVGKDTPNAGRNLSDKALFNKLYGDRGDFGVLNEGSQVKAIGVTLEKTLVECKYKALMHQHSHEVDVAVRTQYGFNLEALGDMGTADELAWEVDRELVDALVAFAMTNSRGIKSFDPNKGGTYNSLTPSEQKAYDQIFVRKTLTEVEIEMSDDIYKRPTWYLCGTNVAKLLARTPEALAERTGSDYFDQSLVSGSIIASGRMKSGEIVWHDPQLDDDIMVVGHTNNMNPFYAGFIMLPFGAASLLTASFLDPDVLLHKKSRAIAFAKVGVNKQQYRVVRLGLS